MFFVVQQKYVHATQSLELQLQIFKSHDLVGDNANRASVLCERLNTGVLKGSPL